MTELILFLLTFEIINIGYAYPIAFLITALLIPILSHRQVYFNFLLSAEFWLLLCVGMTYVFIDTGLNDISNIYHHCVLPVVAFAIGWSVTEGRDDSKIRNNILSLTVGFGTHASLNAFLNIGNSRYSLIDVWTGSFRAATGSGTLNTMTVSAFPYTVLHEKRKSVKLFLSVIFILTVVYMFMLGTRTQFIILIITLFFGIIFYNLKKSGVTGFFKCILIIAVIVGVLAVIYFGNLFSIRDLILSTNLAERYTNRSSLNDSDSFRIQSIFTGIKELFEYPLGGRSEQTYRHNMWLDVARVSGIIPFSLLLAYSIKNFVNVILINRDKNVLSELKFLLLFLYIGIYINFSIEPIWEGAWSFFLSVCILDGMTAAIRRRSTR